MNEKSIDPIIEMRDAMLEAHITPAMVVAGRTAFLSWDRQDDWNLERLVVLVYLSMYRAKREN